MSGIAAVTYLIIEWSLKLVAVPFIILRQRGRTANTIAWIAVVLAVPVLGLLAYLLVGEVRLGRRRIERYRTIVARIHQRAAPPKPGSHPEIDPRFRSIAALAETVGQTGPRGGNELMLIGDTDLFVQSLVEDIDDAELHCHLEYYIYLTDHSSRRVGEALMRAAGRGVTCRLLVDAVGARSFLGSELHDEMVRAGVRVVEALPASFVRMMFSRIDLRNHRKIAVIDGRIGYMGSQNIADAEFAIKKRFAPWIDTSVRAIGPVVHDLQRLFVEDWYLDTDDSLEEVLAIAPPWSEQGVIAQVIGTGPTAYNEALHQLLQAAVHVASEEIILTTPYFVPDDATLTALCTVAHRGVETHVVLPRRNDAPIVSLASRGHYEQILIAGVHLYEYTRGMLHSKTMTVDRDLALISTANLDRRSLDLNFEVSMVVFDSDFASQLRFLQRSYESDSQRVTLADWKNKAWTARLIYNSAGLLSPLL